MREGLFSFYKDESGAVSVDWVVLSVSVICLGCLAVMTASDGTFGLADSISKATAETEVLSGGQQVDKDGGS
ncbi:MAG: hypothetical protein AAF678_08940 [Pseudomonadota bacterium]